MSIEAMKQALDNVCNAKLYEINRMNISAERIRRMDKQIHALRQAIEQAEKQEPVAWMSVDCVGDRYLHFSKPLDNDPVTPLYTEPVQASDISQERVDETAKREHEWVGLDGDIPGLGLVTEEFYNGMLCAEDILRKKNT
jgi:hypothetical protein